MHILPDTIFFFSNTVLNFPLLVLRPFILPRLIFGPPPLNHSQVQMQNEAEHTHRGKVNGEIYILHDFFL